MPFETVKDMVVTALKKEGFGIPEIDVREKFKEKLGIDFRKYVILGDYERPMPIKPSLPKRILDSCCPAM